MTLSLIVPKSMDDSAAWQIDGQLVILRVGRPTRRRTNTRRVLLLREHDRHRLPASSHVMRVTGKTPERSIDGTELRIAVIGALALGVTDDLTRRLNGGSWLPARL